MLGSSLRRRRPWVAVLYTEVAVTPWVIRERTPGRESATRIQQTG
jgi:hypothetical protein